MLQAPLLRARGLPPAESLTRSARPRSSGPCCHCPGDEFGAFGLQLREFFFHAVEARLQLFDDLVLRDDLWFCGASLVLGGNLTTECHLGEVVEFVGTGSVTGGAQFVGLSARGQRFGSPIACGCDILT